MPTPTDWRTNAKDLDTLERPELAAEFLQRNHVYGKDYDQTALQVAAGVLSEAQAYAAMAGRWGLSFRLRPR